MRSYRTDIIKSGRIPQKALSISISMVYSSPWVCPLPWEVLPSLLFSLSIFEVPIEDCIALNIFSCLGKVMGPRVVLSLNYVKAYIMGIMVFYYYNLLVYSGSVRSLKVRLPRKVLSWMLLTCLPCFSLKMMLSCKIGRRTTSLT